MRGQLLHDLLKIAAGKTMHIEIPMTPADDDQRNVLANACLSPALFEGDTFGLVVSHLQHTRWSREIQQMIGNAGPTFPGDSPKVRLWQKRPEMHKDGGKNRMWHFLCLGTAG